MQVTIPETSLKADSSTGIFLRILHIFQKLLCTEHLRMTALVDFFIPTKVLSIDFFFTFIFYLIFSLLLSIIAIMRVLSERV